MNFLNFIIPLLSCKNFLSKLILYPLPFIVSIAGLSSVFTMSNKKSSGKLSMSASKLMFETSFLLSILLELLVFQFASRSFNETSPSPLNPIFKIICIIYFFDIQFLYHVMTLYCTIQI